MATPIGHERQITFFNSDGHDHDGQNSSPVVILPGAISLHHLNNSLIDWINSRGGRGVSADSGVMAVPDLEFSTPPIGPGASYTGTVSWVGLSIVHFMRILMSHDTECTITFYHNNTFADEDREFRATRCSNKFLWEGAWAHFDESAGKNIYYKIENTGNQPAAFQVKLKSATMTANVYAKFIEAIIVNGSEMTGILNLTAGNGVEIETLENNITIRADIPETTLIRRWALTPHKPVAFTATSPITNPEYLLDGRHDRAASFGSGLQWIQADLGVVTTLGAININQYQPDGRVFNGVRVEVSTDASNWFEVKSAGPVWANQSGLEITMLNGRLARYIRVWCNGSTVNSTNFINKITPMTLSNKE